MKIYSVKPITLWDVEIVVDNIMMRLSETDEQ